AIEPGDLALAVEDHDAIRQRRRRTLDLPHELHEPLLVITLAPVKPHDLRDHLAPHAAELRRIGEAAVAHPPVEPEQMDELPAEVRGERDGEADPGIAEDPAAKEADGHGCDQPDRREPPDSLLTLHGRGWSLRPGGKAIPGATDGLN